ncbi:MAG TPA: amidohydrolase [Bryobacteraceae bacterium]|nr:amidohydrolase [Bryobacteraceae bacterium]
MRRFCSFLIVGSLLSRLLLAADPADWIIRGKYVVTMDGHNRMIEGGAVAIRDTRIVGVGSQEDIARRFQAKHTLDKPDAIIAPGLIDTHTHAPMSLFRALADDMRLDDWLNNFIFPAESKNVSPDFVRWGTRLACLEMVLAGITTYTDMYYFEDVEAETAKQAGVRGVLGQTIIGFPAPDHKTWQEAIAATEKYIQHYQKDDLIVPAVAPHSIYTTPDEALVAAHQLAVKYNVPLSIHLAETQKERDDSLTKRNLSPTQVLEKLGLLDGRVIAAHCVWESPEDIDILKQHGTGVAHCPSSNMKLASGVAHVTEMLNRGLSVGLGTDGFAGSNDTADLILEMNIAAKLQKVTTMDPTVLPAEQVFAMATIGGARVLGLDKEIGSLEEGKRADIITISVARPNAVPLYNVYSQIAYATKSGDVDDVFINGKQIVSERKVLTLDAKEIYAKAEQFKQQILASLHH